VELALRGLGVDLGDEVVLAGYDFPGNFRAIEAVGGVPVLVDVHPANWNLDPGQVAAALGDRTRAIVVSHLHGGIVPMRDLRRLADARGLGIVEDACQATGATVQGRPAGTWGDVGVWSFGGSKLLTAGRGGAIFTRREDVHQRVKVYCERGNHAFPLSELQAAVLVPQLAALDERNRTRGAAVERLRTALASAPGLTHLANDPAAGAPAYYKLGLQYAPEALGGATRDAFIQRVQAEGVALDAGFRGFTRRSTRRCRRAGDLVESGRASQGMLVLHHPVLLEPAATIDRVAEAIRRTAAGFLVGRVQ
jgi:dTDP-4-amino-4,6-dideoxygalactose transaminase